MSILSFLTGESSLRRQRDSNIRSAQQMYDPSIFQPMLDQQRQQAVEGMPRGQQDIARQRTVQQLFRPQDTSLFGGNQAGAIAGAQAQSRGGQQAMADFEGQLSIQNMMQQQQGRQQFAQTQTQANQMGAQRDATIDQIEGQFEAERSRRRQAVGAGAASLVGAAITTPFGPAGQTLAGRALGSVFGGGEDDDSVSRGQYLADVARAGVGVGGGTDEQSMDQAFDNVNIPELSFDQTPLGGQQAQMQAQQGSPFEVPDDIMSTPMQREMTREEMNPVLQQMGYRSDGTPMGTPPEMLARQQPPQQQQDAGGFNFVEDMLNNQQSSQQAPQQTGLLGDRMLGNIPAVMGNLAGVPGQALGHAATGLQRTGLNFLDVMGRGLSQGLAQPERQEIAQLQQLYGDNWQEEIQKLRDEFQGANLDDRYLRRLLLHRANQ